MKKCICVSILIILSFIGIASETSAHSAKISPQKYVALTFDDGPNASTTPRLLNILKSRNAHATFFMVGKNARQFSGIVKRLYDEGNMIGDHSWDHADLKLLSRTGATDEIQKTQDMIYKITGHAPIVFRPPYGSQSRETLDILRTSHLASVQRSLDSNDWKQPSTGSLVERVMNNVQPGSIILMHDTLLGTIQAMPQILDALQKSGYTIVTISTLLGGDKNIHPGWIYRREI